MIPTITELHDIDPAYFKRDSKQSSLREELSKAFMTPWFNQVVSSTHSSGLNNTTSVSVKDEQIDAILDAVIAALPQQDHVFNTTYNQVRNKVIDEVRVTLETAKENK